MVIGGGRIQRTFDSSGRTVTFDLMLPDDYKVKPFPKGYSYLYYRKAVPLLTFELLNKLFEAENLAESAADPSKAGEITTDEGHIDIGGVKLEIRPEKKMGFLTAGFNGLTAQMA